jgi:hypothetical protein
MGALIYEGIAGDEQEAERIASSGEIEFAPCHHYHTVGPMAGVVSPSMPVFIIENKTYGNRAFRLKMKAWEKCCVMAAWVLRCTSG